LFQNYELYNLIRFHCTRRVSAWNCGDRSEVVGVSSLPMSLGLSVSFSDVSKRDVNK